jgi:hypothetical protein
VKLLNILDFAVTLAVVVGAMVKGFIVEVVETECPRQL